MKELILGGMKSGKSRLAENLAKLTNKNVIYIATSAGNDQEMLARVEKHRSFRPANWKTIEEPIKLAETLQQNANQNTCLLVDCLTLWMTNLLVKENEVLLTTEIEKLLNVLIDLPGHIIFVSNETGLGIIPLGDLTRRFCDETGLLHQNIASLCDRVIFTVAGLPHILKGSCIKGETR